MFNWIGKQAADGAIDRIKDFVIKTDWAKQAAAAGEKVPVIKEIMAVLPDIYAGYEKLTPEQRAALWAKIMILLATV